MYHVSGYSTINSGIVESTHIVIIHTVKYAFNVKNAI